MFISPETCFGLKKKLHCTSTGAFVHLPGLVPRNTACSASVFKFDIYCPVIQNILWLFLAQKLGLVEAPKPVLSENEWKAVKYQSNDREDSKQPCVICKEDFGTGEQVKL